MEGRDQSRGGDMSARWFGFTVGVVAVVGVFALGAGVWAQGKWAAPPEAKNGKKPGGGRGRGRASGPRAGGPPRPKRRSRGPGQPGGRGRRSAPPGAPDRGAWPATAPRE